MLAKNNTPFAALAFEQIHRDGQRMAVIAVRATYALSEAGELTLADNQALVLADEYAGKPHETSLLRAGDLIPFKPATDITVIGSTYPIGAKRAASWECGIKVGALKHVLRCSGQRYWEAATKKKGARTIWRLSEPEARESAVLDYSHAAGGRIIGDPDHGESPLNPLGTGILHPEFTPGERRIAAPTIDTAAAAVGDPFADIEPQGMAPIPPFWHFRLRHAGTYDEKWRDGRHPQLPEDFDYRFYQTAHPALVYPGYLHGDEVVSFAGLTPGRGLRRFRLPSVQPYAVFDWVDGRQVTARLHLDGLHLDLRDGPPWRVDITWRGWVVICPAFFKIDLFHTGLGDPTLKGRIPICDEEGLRETDDAPVGFAEMKRETATVPAQETEREPT